MGSQTVQQRWLAAIRDGKDGLRAGPVAVLYVLATFMDWAKPTDQPPRFAGWNTKPPGCGAPGCSNGTVEDPNDDYRPHPCPACQPQRVNGHRP